MTTKLRNAKAAIVEVNRAAAAKPADIDNGWGTRHRTAWNIPTGFEAAVVGLATALAEYADQHAARYESPLGDDGVLGVAWLDMLKGWRSLLNGELGRLDGGTCDAIYYAVGRAAGFDDKELEA